MKKSVTVPKKKLIGALLAAKQAGAMQAVQSAPPPGPPPGPPAGPPPMGMKKGGFVPFGKKGEEADAKTPNGKKKWIPPWAKKKEGGTVKAFSAGGSVGGRGDGCAQRGKTRGTMR